MRKWLRWINVFLKFCRATDIFIFPLPIATQIQRLIIFAIIYAKDVGALLRLSRIWALALPRTRISNSIAHAEIYWDCRNRMDRVQYTQSGRFSCVSSSAWICEIQMLKITFVNVLFTNKIWPAHPFGLFESVQMYELFLNVVSFWTIFFAKVMFFSSSQPQANRFWCFLRYRLTESPVTYTTLCEKCCRPTTRRVPSWVSQKTPSGRTDSRSNRKQTKGNNH